MNKKRARARPFVSSMEIDRLLAPALFKPQVSPFGQGLRIPQLRSAPKMASTCAIVRPLIGFSRLT